MPAGYITDLRRCEWKEILKGLVPSGILRFRNYLRMRKRFPDAYVSGDSCVDQGAQIGRGCIIRSSHLGANVAVGAYSTLGQGCSMAGEGAISIGKFCSIGPNVFVCSRGHRHKSRTTYPLKLWTKGAALSEDEYSAAPISIGNDVWVGQRSIILAGAVIPDGCVVGAGSVVGRRTYPPYSVIAGTPAEFRKFRFEQEHVQELLALRWWDKEEDTIFNDLREYLLAEPTNRS